MWIDVALRCRDTHVLGVYNATTHEAKRDKIGRMQKASCCPFLLRFQGIDVPLSNLTSDIFVSAILFVKSIQLEYVFAHELTVSGIREASTRFKYAKFLERSIVMSLEGRVNALEGSGGSKGNHGVGTLRQRVVNEIYIYYPGKST